MGVRFFVLAGGSGTRFRPWTLIIPKCLIGVGGKPAVRWIIEDIMAQGFDDIVVCINKKDETYFRYELRDLSNLKFSVSEEPMGTSGEVLVARRFIGGPFVLRYGDDLTELDYRALINFHKEKKAIVTIAVTTKFRLPVGVMELDEDRRVLKFKEKPYLDKFVWAAVAVLDPKAIAYFKNGEDIATHALPKMIEAGEPVYAFVIHSPWFDVGSVEGWTASDQYFRKKLGEGG